MNSQINLRVLYNSGKEADSLSRHIDRALSANSRFGSSLYRLGINFLGQATIILLSEIEYYSKKVAYSPLPSQMEHVLIGQWSFTQMSKYLCMYIGISGLFLSFHVIFSIKFIYLIFNLLYIKKLCKIYYELQKQQQKKNLIGSQNSISSK